MIKKKKRPKTKKKQVKKNKKKGSITNIRKLTRVNGIPIPATPGTLHHAVISSLAASKEVFCKWDKIVELCERYVIQFGGDEAWEKFDSKYTQEEITNKIKQEVSTLGRKGKKYPAYLLHHSGNAIYYFKDGAIMHVGGTFTRRGPTYEVVFKKGRKLQTRKKGHSMKYKEFNQFVENGIVDPCGNILDKNKLDAIKNIEIIEEDEELLREILGF